MMYNYRIENDLTRETMKIHISRPELIMLAGLLRTDIGSIYEKVMSSVDITPKDKDVFLDYLNKTPHMHKHLREGLCYTLEQDKF